MKDEFQKAGDILRELFSHLNFREGETYLSFFSDWTNLVGLDLASHGKPVDIRQGALIVQVDHPGWIQMFQLKQKRILNRIRKKHPSLNIVAIHYRLSDGPSVPPEQRSPLQSSRRQESSPGKEVSAPGEVGRATDPVGAATPREPLSAPKRIEGGKTGESRVSPPSIPDERLRAVLKRLEKQVRNRNRGRN